VRALAPVAGPAGRAVATWPVRSVVVEPGDTVWDLIAPHVPAGHSRQVYAAQVLDHNRVEASAALRPGMVLRLPDS
nr:LysM peptidoglycan-binding domain-containing protein [Euzebyales bacterium]MBA3622093.1 LysM peptidoglycan-binding domain-containing protein [Euzebyales bacterium]